MPRSGPGITVYHADSAMIGGTIPGAGNLISGASNNGGFGVYILQSGNTHIVGNLIGTAADGTTPLPNELDGVFIDDEASNNFVGGQIAGSGNTIAFNGRNGVAVQNDVPQVRSNTIRGNSIYANAAGGIALISNANDNLAPPTIDGIGPLHGSACAFCTVEIFSDAADQGRVFEGSVFTNDGNWTFDAPVSGPQITATNTDISNNTSPFSAPFSLTSPTPTPSLTPTPSRTLAPPTATRTPTRTAMPTATSTRVASVTAAANATTTASRTATATVSTTTTTIASRTATGTASPSSTATQTPASGATATLTPTPAANATATAPSSRTATATAALTASRTARSRTVTSTAAPSTTGTQTPASSVTATVSPTLAVNATATATVAPCTGDCNGDHVVSIDELITDVGIALGTQPLSACPAIQDAVGTVDIAQLIQAVRKALTGCAAVA